MKFDVVIGNPPYNRGMDLDFVKLGYDISTKYVCMITPAKWQTADADQRISSNISYGEFRRQLVPHMSHVCFYPCCKDMFDILQVDGVSYFLMDKEKHATAVVQNVSKYFPELNGKEVRDITKRQSLVNIGNSLVEYLGDYTRFQFSNTFGKARYQVWMNTQTPGGSLSTVTSRRPTLFVGAGEIEDISSGVQFEHSPACTFRKWASPKALLSWWFPPSSRAWKPLVLAAPGDAAAGQVIGRKLYGDLVAGIDADVVHAHLAGNVGQYLVSVGQLYLKHGVGEGFRDNALDFDYIRLGQVFPPPRISTSAARDLRACVPPLRPH